MSFRIESNKVCAFFPNFYASVRAQGIMVNALS